MSREYYKRILVVWSIVVLFMAYICASAVTLLPNSAQIQSIYFIVEPTDSVAASSSSMSLRGGAGYVMADGGVAFSVYFSKAQAELAGHMQNLMENIAHRASKTASARHEEMIKNLE